MKAMVNTEYGDPQEVLHLEEVPKPEPKAGEVLVRVYASGVNFADTAFVRGEPAAARLWSGLLRPKHTTPGSDIAGVVEAVGEGVSAFEPGDEVFGNLATGWGAYAEYVAAPEGLLARKPSNVTFQEAAVVPESAIVALQGLRDKGQIQSGQHVLIHGASGGIGTFAVQIAKAFGAEVSAVCSTRNVEMVRSLGADHIIDYTREDFTQSGQLYDLILATVGSTAIADYRRALRPSGIYVATGGDMNQIFQAMLLGPLISLTSSKTMTNLMADINGDDLAYLAGLLEAGRMRPVIDRCYPLNAVPDALAYYEQRRTQGKIAITMTNGS